VIIVCPIDAIIKLKSLPKQNLDSFEHCRRKCWYIGPKSIAYELEMAIEELIEVYGREWAN
jgi:hypothetical protein